MTGPPSGREPGPSLTALGHPQGLFPRPPSGTTPADPTGPTSAQAEAPWTRGDPHHPEGRMLQSGSATRRAAWVLGSHRSSPPPQARLQVPKLSHRKASSARPGAPCPQRSQGPGLTAEGARRGAALYTWWVREWQGPWRESTCHRNLRIPLLGSPATVPMLPPASQQPPALSLA